MKRRTKGLLLASGVAVAAAVASIVLLSAAFAKVVDPHNQCETGFSSLINCSYHSFKRSTHLGTPMFPLTPASIAAREAFRPGHEAMASGVVECPQNTIARRLLCAVPPAAFAVRAASNDLVTDFPRPKPWLLTTAKDSPFIKAVHVETPLDLAGVLGFYRAELLKRGWTEDAGAIVEPDRTVIAFTTSDGPAQLRLTRHEDRTIVDLSLLKPADRNAERNADILPKPGQVRLRFGNATDEVAAITINEQTIELAARAGHELSDDPGTGRKPPGSPEITLPPGKYKVALKIASGAPLNREFEVAADETWGLLADHSGIMIPVRLY